MTAERTQLVIGCCEPSSHRAKALLDGTLRLPNCGIRFVKLGPGDMLYRSFADPDLNVAELSLSGYVARVAAGGCPYVILPVYIARIFAHSTFYARADRDIETPADLRGKRVGTGAYQRTLNVWARGLLEDEYGVSAHEVQWVIRDASDAVNACNRRDMPIEIANTNATLSEMLETGQLDAMIAARPPECFTRGARNVKRLIEDEAQASKEYFRRTELFPILHVMGMRVELARSKPMLARELFGAFAKARNLASVQARESGSWPQEAYSYGLGAPDRKTLATFLSYHHRQGISDRQVALEELFAPLSTQAFGT